MFTLLALSCTDPAYCPPNSYQITGYHTKPAMTDPYRYIRTGNYAKILAQEAWNEPRSSRDRERPLRYSHSEDQQHAHAAAAARRAR